jgi:hypothetical protein
MKPTRYSILLKTALLIIPLTLYFGGPTIAKARDRNLLSPGPVRPGSLDYRTELPEGFLKVYSATDEFDDGGVPYHAHSSYAIYTAAGRLFKNVENHMSRSDEIPEIVALPIGSYIIEARSERNGYVRVRVLVKAGQQTILHLDVGDEEPALRLAHN